ncbi:MAG: carboxypeptidase regulatory-like domain-containing protein [Pyrinomonadaceae bacterium]
MKKLSSLIFTLTILLLVTSEIAASCPGVFQYAPCAEYWRADAVFIAEASDVQVKGQRFGGVPAPMTVRLTIEESFKGTKEKEIVLELNDCGYQFRQGEKYLIYAQRRENGNLDVRVGQSRTKPIVEATEDLDYIRSLQRGEPQAQIVGRIGQQTADIKQTRYSSERSFFGLPMVGVKVFARGGEQTFEAFSDEKGFYKFAGLPAGEYEVWADYPSYFKSEKISVKTKTEGCGIGYLTAWRKGSISGRVTEADGSPVREARLSLVSADATAEEMFEEREFESVWNLAATDEKGEYTFATLPAGRYFIVINLTNFERTRGNERLQKIPRIFYPGVGESEKASVISIEEGEQIKGKDFRLPKSK